MRLNLGCGNLPRDGWVNHDRQMCAPCVDIAHDLDETPWPWADNSCSAIRAVDLLEHLSNFITFFNECWRILQPGGTIIVRVPRWDNVQVHIDPTHKRGYHAQSFDYLDPDTDYGAQYGMYTTRKWHILKVQDGLTITALMAPRKEVDSGDSC